MFTSPLLAVFAERASDWNPLVGLVMIISNIIAIAIGRYTIQHKKADPQLPSPELFGGMGFPALIGTTSLGHILGAGAILGLSNMGAL